MVVFQPQEVTGISFINADFQQSKIIKNHETISVFNLVVAGIDLIYFFAAKLNSKVPPFPQNVINFLFKTAYFKINL